MNKTVALVSKCSPTIVLTASETFEKSSKEQQTLYEVIGLPFDDKLIGSLFVFQHFADSV
jgi:hypothetical protein